jgi:hypothetical protein
LIVAQRLVDPIIQSGGLRTEHWLGEGIREPKATNTFSGRFPFENTFMEMTFKQVKR